jgi:Zn-dependent oligopeptidase
MMARTSNYALRLLTSLKAEAEKVAAEEGTTLNQFINVAVAEKVAALRTARYFQERAARADLAVFDQLLARAGEEPPRPGDELPDA